MTQEKPLDIFQDPLMRKVIGGLKSCINDHGPVTRELISSAAKRIYGNIKDINNACTIEKLASAQPGTSEASESEPGEPGTRPSRERSVAELVKGTTVEFICYRDGELWYRVIYATVIDGENDCECRKCGGTIRYSYEDQRTVHDDCPGYFEFPVPITDTGSGIFHSSMKAITLMRWIRKYLEVQKTWNR